MPQILDFMEKISKAQVKLVRSLQQKKFRDELGLFVAEGDKCVEELRKGFELVQLIINNEQLTSRDADVRTVIATPTEIEQMSGLRTPQGVIGVFKKNTEYRTQSTDLITNDLILALDGIQDPGNLGTIIRTCDWFGVHDIFCSLDTADCYNPKVVQATMGALARVRLHYVDLPAFIASYKGPVYGTLLDGENMYEVLESEKTASLKDKRPLRSKTGVIVMGNEGNGISEEVRKLVTHPIRIPSYPNKEASDVVESLNVSIATSIVLAEFRRSSGSTPA